MMRRLAFVAVLGAFALAFTACNNRFGSASGNGDATAKVEIGSPLYQPKPWPKSAPPAGKVMSPEGKVVEPIIIPAHSHVVDKADIPSQRDGKILFIGTELKDGENPLPGRTIYVHPYKGKAKRYQSLQPGVEVVADQLVMVLDDREAQAEYDIHASAVQPAADELKSAEFTLASVDEILQRYLELERKSGGTASNVEVLKAKVDVARASSDVATKKAALTKAQEELKKAAVLLEMYYIRSPINGMIQPFNRTPGEGVKANDTIFQVLGTTALRAEGTVPTGYHPRLARGMPVLIEASREEMPTLTLPNHRKAITGIAIGNRTAIGNNTPEPVIVTSSEDKTVSVSTRAGVVKKLPHPVAVRCVACTGVGAKAHLCLSGADDGHGRIWDLDAANPEPLVLKDPEPTRPAHRGVITSVAFSPTGQFCATADSRDICLWDVASGTFKYRFQTPHHQGDITSMQFTPQAKLISTSRDNTIAIWSLGDKQASLDSVLEGRSGDVTRPGVSSDGLHMLFDVGQSLRILSLPDQRPEAEIRNSADSYKFASFAYFTPDDRMILTGTSTDNRLTLWKAPTANSYAAEVRQFVADGQPSFTCAAVSPLPNLPFAAAGSKDGHVYVWPFPTEESLQPLRGQISFIDNASEASSRQIRVYASFENSKAKVLPGGNVTVVVENPASVREK